MRCSAHAHLCRARLHWGIHLNCYPPKKMYKKEVKVIQLSSPKQVKEPLPRLGVDFEVGVLLEVVFDRTKKVFCSKSRLLCCLRPRCSSAAQVEQVSWLGVVHEA